MIVNSCGTLCPICRWHSCSIIKPSGLQDKTDRLSSEAQQSSLFIIIISTTNTKVFYRNASRPTMTTVNRHQLGEEQNVTSLGSTMSKENGTDIRTRLAKGRHAFSKLNNVRNLEQYILPRSRCTTVMLKQSCCMTQNFGAWLKMTYRRWLHSTVAVSEKSATPRRNVTA